MHFKVILFQRKNARLFECSYKLAKTSEITINVHSTPGLANDYFHDALLKISVHLFELFDLFCSHSQLYVCIATKIEFCNYTPFNWRHDKKKSIKIEFIQSSCSN